MKRLFLVLGIFGASMVFGAGEFDQVTGVIDSFDSSTSSTSGFFLRTIMGWAPLICMGAGIFLSLKHSKKQADQEQDSTKIFISAFIAALLGGLAGVLIDAMIGAALLQSATDGLQVLANYWKDALGI